MKYIYTLLIKTFIFSILLANVSVSFAQPQFLDPTFGNGGKVVTAVDTFNVFGSDMLIQPDGKILVTATQAFYDLTCVVRYNVDGSLDNSFGNNGIANYSPSLGYSNSQCIALQSDGKILTGGRTFGNNQSSAFLIRYKPNGSLDSSFGVNGFVTTYVDSHTGTTKIIIKPDGKILTAIQTHDGLAHLIQYKSTGIPDSSFGQNGIANSPIYSSVQGPIAMTDLKLQNDGKIVSSGFISTYPSGFLVFRFQANGTIDSSFGNIGLVQYNQFDNARGIDIQTNGKLILTGLDSNYKVLVVRLNQDGTLDNSFGISGSSIVDLDSLPNDVGFPFIQPDGKILVPATNFSRRLVPGVGPGGIRDNNYSGDFVLLRFNTNGSLDSSFGINGKILTDFDLDDFAYAVSVQSDGKLLIAGGVSDSTKYNIGVARYGFNVLPLQLLTFSAKRVSSSLSAGEGRGEALLQWTTAQEIYVDRFEIERSYNGRDYAAIGTMQAGKTSYTFIDNNPNAATNYYRLRMIDKDGKFTYSPVRMVENGIGADVSVYPNPAKDVINIQGNSMAELRLLDNAGRVVLYKKLSSATAAILKISGIAKGTYLLQVVNVKGKIENKKIVVE